MDPSATDQAIQRIFERCSNAGRWGESDELGTLNLIGEAQRIGAARLVQRGSVVSFGFPLAPSADGKVVHRMLAGSARIRSAQDVLEVAPHGFRISHVDALGHVAHAGSVYNDHLADDAITADGLAFGSVMAFSGGIVTRGVLLDVAATRGVAFLEPGDTVEPADRDAAADRCELTIEPGDAVLVRVGLGVPGYPTSVEDTGLRAGLSPECAAWLRERDVAAYGGDCVERLPSGSAAFPMPFHAIGLVSMGLCILDNVDMETLARACSDIGRRVGGTGSAVNPLAIF
jgi:hypothetical protein